MLSEWEAQSRYDMDFLVEQRTLDAALRGVREFLDANGIQEELQENNGCRLHTLFSCSSSH